MTGPVDEGGDPACWAHLVDLDGAVVADLADLLDGGGDGVHWTLPTAADLNVNLVRLEAGHEMGRHTNHELDVLLVVLAGRGHVVVDARTLTLARHSVALIPKGAARWIVAGSSGLTYLSVHRRSGGLQVGRRSADA